jgi:hypothetical protein
VLVLAVAKKCGGSSKAAGTPEPQVSSRFQSVAGLSTAQLDKVFVTVADTQLPNLTDAKRIEAGHAVCAYMTAGKSWVETVALLVHDGLTGGQAGQVITAAAGAYCQSNQGELPTLSGVVAAGSPA